MIARGAGVVALVAAVAAGSVVAIALMASSDGDGNAESRRSGARVVRNCDSRVEGERQGPPSTRDDVVLGPVVFYGLRQSGRRAAANPAKWFASENREYRPTKIIAEVRASTVVTVRIGPASSERAALLYQFGTAAASGASTKRTFGYRLSDGQQAVEFRSCSPGERDRKGRPVGDTTQYNGGFVVAAPQCLRLEAVVEEPPQRHSQATPFGTPARSCRS
jgi:hypothetical protein